MALPKSRTCGQRGGTAPSYHTRLLNILLLGQEVGCQALIWITQSLDFSGSEVSVNLYSRASVVVLMKDAYSTTEQRAELLPLAWLPKSQVVPLSLNLYNFIAVVF